MNPVILSDNRFADGTPTATDAASGYDAVNVKDLRPYTFWKALAQGTKYITVLSNLVTTGDNKVTGFTNGDGGEQYESFSSSGASIVAANTYGDGNCYSNVLNLTVGTYYKVTVDLTFNSGAVPVVYTGPTIYSGAGSVVRPLSNGSNVVRFKATSQDVYLGIWCNPASDFFASVSLYEVASGGVADTLGIIGHNLCVASALVSVESSDDTVTWTQRLAPFTPTGDKALLQTFTLATAAYWRVKIVTASIAPYIGVLMLGARLVFPFPPDSPFDPYNEGIVAEIQNSVTGNPLGSVVSYFPVSQQPVFPYPLRTWVLTYYKPFWDNHARYLKHFFWAWDLTAYSDLILYCRMTKDAKFTFPASVGDYVDSLALDMEAVAEP